MRSDRNPYHILSKSKNAQVQAWLAKAHHMTESEINSLSIKPDLKKAMLYLVIQGRNSSASSAAEQFADKMQQAHAPQVLCMDIYRYMGQTTFIPVTHMSKIEIKAHQFFGFMNNQTFVNHCWSPLSMNPWLISQSVFECQADATHLNRLNQDRLTKIFG